MNGFFTRLDTQAMIEIKKLSRGEICVKNFIPPANGASLGSFLCSKFRLG